MKMHRLKWPLSTQIPYFHQKTQTHAPKIWSMDLNLFPVFLSCARLINLFDDKVNAFSFRHRREGTKNCQTETAKKRNHQHKLCIHKKTKRVKDYWLGWNWYFSFSFVFSLAVCFASLSFYMCVYKQSRSHLYDFHCIYYVFRYVMRFIYK